MFTLHGQRRNLEDELTDMKRAITLELCYAWFHLRRALALALDPHFAIATGAGWIGEHRRAGLDLLRHRAARFIYAHSPY